MAAADVDAPPTDRVAPPPLVVAYDSVTGVPAEFNEFLPTNCDEYKRWKAQQDGFDAAASEPSAPGDAPTAASADEVAEGVAKLAVSDDAAAAAPAKPEKKSKKKGKEPAVVMEVATRGKKKSVTTVSGLDLFGVKLAEAAKLMGKKFASGASVTKTPEGGEQIEVQGDVAARAADLVLATYKDAGFEKKHFFLVVNKKKSALFPDE